MKLIVSCRELHYAGRCRAEGEVFEASDNDAKVLKLAKRAADAPIDATPVGHIASTRPAPSPPSEEVTAISDVLGEDAPKRSRVYRRRDLTAED